MACTAALQLLLSDTGCNNKKVNAKPRQSTLGKYTRHSVRAATLATPEHFV